MSDLPTFTPEPPPQTEQRPKRGPRKKAEAAVPKKPKRKYTRKTKEVQHAFIPSAIVHTKVSPVELVLEWWNVLIQLDSKARKEVLAKILA